MTPEANDALHRIMKDYPSVQWTQDGPDTVILYFEHVRAYVYLCAAGDGLAPIALDEARARAELDALLDVTSAEPIPEPAPLPAPSPAQVEQEPEAIPPAPEPDPVEDPPAEEEKP